MSKIEDRDDLVVRELTIRSVFNVDDGTFSVTVSGIEDDLRLTEVIGLLETAKLQIYEYYSKEDTE